MTFQKIPFLECIDPGTYNERSSISFAETTDDQQPNTNGDSKEGSENYKDKNSKIRNVA